jgi:hypothetical protein
LTPVPDQVKTAGSYTPPAAWINVGRRRQAVPGAQLRDRTAR